MSNVATEVAGAFFLLEHKYSFSFLFFLSMSSVCGKETNCAASGQMLPLMVFAVTKGRSGVSLVLSG